MRALLAVYRRTLVGTVHALPLVTLYAAIAILALAVTVVLTGVLGLKPLVAADAESPGVGVILGVTGCVAALISGGLVFTVLFGAPLTREQSSGRLVAVIASPAGARRTVFGRSLALWTIAAVAAVGGAATTVVVMRLVWARSYPLSSIDGGYLLCVFAYIPLFLLGMAIFVTALGLMSGAVAGTVAANISYVAATSTMGRLAGSGLSVQWYATSHLLLACLFFGAGLICLRFVSRERLVLACR